MSELYQLPNGWEYKQLDEIVFRMHQGVNTAADKVEFYSNGYPIIQSRNITSGELHFDNIKYVNEEDWNLYEKKYKPKINDILLSNIGTIGKSIIVSKNDNFLIHWNIFLIEPQTEIVLTQFLKLFFDKLDNDSYYDQFLKGATVKFVSKKNLASTLVPLPPLSEQQRIVLKLDLLFQKIDKSIELHQKNMDEADTFMGSVLNEVFGEMDGQYKKENLVKFDRKMSAGGTPLRAKNEYWDDGTIEWFSSGELNQQFTLPAKERITNEGLKNSSAKLFSKGTLLMGMYDTAAMKMSILHTDASCNQAIVGIKPNEDELNIFFLKYQLEYLKPKILEERQGVRQQNLNLSKIKNVEIEFPTLDIQIKVVEYLDSISEKMEKVKSIQKEKMDSLKALKASILDKAFRGEL